MVVAPEVPSLPPNSSSLCGPALASLGVHGRDGSTPTVGCRGSGARDVHRGCQTSRGAAAELRLGGRLRGGKGFPPLPPMGSGGIRGSAVLPVVPSKAMAASTLAGAKPTRNDAVASPPGARRKGGSVPPRPKTQSVFNRCSVCDSHACGKGVRVRRHHHHPGPRPSSSGGRVLASLSLARMAPPLL